MKKSCKEIIKQFTNELEEMQQKAGGYRFFTEPEQVFPNENVYKVLTKKDYIFDDAFWEIFDKYPFCICHVAFYGTRESPESQNGYFDLRFDLRKLC